MRFNVLSAVVAIALFIGYFGPLIVKLKEIPLAIVVLGGIALVAYDIWESFADRSR